ncbi:DUF5348 domain-containing protein [Alicyclobacillus sp. ALC3]|uniref:DUF5348 domain-containing protein n=1 Tax=Alicyclobacillus sp. ALC3 TaxID=2796143 RepID=UPI002377E08D|nr:DUF5348 domain-containing protein [Alicyclobacillus sp. ALC3]WDL95896.1 DUF5348 domain-containing protein [Alicyclobacillus sp. ALC3]
MKVAQQYEFQPLNPRTEREWYGLHCGEAFHLCIGNKSQLVRLEMASSWYVIADGIALALIEGRTYKVNIDV